MHIIVRIFLYRFSRIIKPPPGWTQAQSIFRSPQVIVAATDTPTPEVTTVDTTVVTTAPTILPTTIEVTVQPSPTSTDNESVSSPPVGNTQTVNETPDAFASNVTTDIQPPENSTLTSEPAGSTGELSSDNSSQVSSNVSAPESSDIGNTTSNLGNTTPNQFINNTVVGSGSTADLNTSFSSDTNSNATELSNMTFSNSTVSESNQTLSVTNSSSPYDSLVDPPLNTSLSNIFYDNISGDWVINQSGESYLDLSILNNSGSGKVQYSDSNTTFSGFGSGFAILINATNVILNGWVDPEW